MLCSGWLGDVWKQAQEDGGCQVEYGGSMSCLISITIVGLFLSFAQAEERKPDLFCGREEGTGDVQQGGEGEAGEQDTRAVQGHGSG